MKIGSIHDESMPLIIDFTIENLYFHEWFSVSIMDHGHIHIFGFIVAQFFDFNIHSDDSIYFDHNSQDKKSKLILLFAFPLFPFHVRIRNYFGFIGVIYDGLMLAPNSSIEELRFGNFVHKLH